jgi:hypothetical protein
MAKMLAKVGAAGGGAIQSGMPTMTSKPVGGSSGFKQVGAVGENSSAGFRTVGNDKPSVGGFKTVGQNSNAGGGWTKVGSSTSATKPTPGTSAPSFRSAGFTTLATTSSSPTSQPKPPPPPAVEAPPPPPPSKDRPQPPLTSIPPPPPPPSDPPQPPPPPPTASTTTPSLASDGPSASPNPTSSKVFQSKGWSTVGAGARTASTSSRSFRPASGTSVPRPGDWVPQGAQPLHPILASDVPAASGGAVQSRNVFGDHAMDEDEPNPTPTQQRPRGTFKSSSSNWRGGLKLGKGRDR